MPSSVRCSAWDVPRGRPGSDQELRFTATDPKILVGLRVHATRDGVGSGREIARLVELQRAISSIPIAPSPALASSRSGEPLYLSQDVRNFRPPGVEL
jgi:hypothetical protein